MNTAQPSLPNPASRRKSSAFLSSIIERTAVFAHSRFARYCLLGAVVPLFFATVTFAASDAIEAVKRADAARIKATLAHDRVALGDLLSEDLIYGQNDKSSITKGPFLLTLTVSQNNYDSYEVDDLKFVEVGPGVVAMSGRAVVKGMQGVKRVDFTNRFLAVYRSEAGKWRLIAYQSARVAEPGSAPAK